MVKIADNGMAISDHCLDRFRHRVDRRASYDDVINALMRVEPATPQLLRKIRDQKRQQNRKRQWCPGNGSMFGLDPVTSTVFVFRKAPDGSRIVAVTCWPLSSG